MSHPETITLSAAAGEAIIERLAVYAPSRSDCERLLQVLRWYFWLAAAVKEAKLSLKKLRTLLLGQGPKPPTRCDQNNACGSVAAHGRECACSRCFFVHMLLISCPGVCQFCPTTSRRSSDVQNLQPAHSEPLTQN